MNLNNITIRLRSRNVWEAMDMGTHLIRSFFPFIWLPWVLYLGLFVVITVPLLGANLAYLAIILLWWFKPLYDVFLLFYFSRGVFGKNPSLHQFAQAFPSLLNLPLLKLLTIKRLQFSRSFLLPITQLESLSKQSHKERQRFLLTSIRSKATWLTLLCLHVEIILFVSIHILYFLLLPNPYQDVEFITYIFNPQTELVTTTTVIFYIIAIAIVEPLYIAAGFMLYLNQRSLLEAWDIEVIFRKTAFRIQGLTTFNLTRKKPHPNSLP